MVRAMSAARFLLTVAAAALAHPARSATDTDVLTVTATVLSACSLSGGATLNFGTYTSGQTNNADVNGTINFVNCSGTLTFALDGGRVATSTPGRCAMVPTASTTSSTGRRCGPRSGGPAPTAQVHILLGTQSGSVTVHGRIPAGQVVPEGTYTDTVNITLTF